MKKTITKNHYKVTYVNTQTREIKEHHIALFINELRPRKIEIKIEAKIKHLCPSALVMQTDLVKIEQFLLEIDLDTILETMPTGITLTPKEES